MNTFVCLTPLSQSSISTPQRRDHPFCEDSETTRDLFFYTVSQNIGFTHQHYRNNKTKKEESSELCRRTLGERQLLPVASSKRRVPRLRPIWQASTSHAAARRLTYI